MLFIRVGPAGGFRRGGESPLRDGERGCRDEGIGGASPIPLTGLFLYDIPDFPDFPERKDSLEDLRTIGVVGILLVLPLRRRPGAS
jgi:hypothetical protein